MNIDIQLLTLQCRYLEDVRHRLQEAISPEEHSALIGIIELLDTIILDASEKL